MKATEHVNPGQFPVLTVDQPLYAIAKEIQWSWPSTYGEEKYVVLMGGLHIEIALLNVLFFFFFFFFFFCDLPHFNANKKKDRQ